MAEIIYGIDTKNSTTNIVPCKSMCRKTGQMCELANDFGYCKVTACVRENKSSYSQILQI